ncbi:MAG: helix-turn-helix domain-containing protein [bacterium]
MDESPGLGATLRAAREARGLSLAQAERLTKIRALFLAALEEERYADLPPRPYAKGFVRAYALALSLDSETVLALFESRIPPAAPPPLREAAEIPLEPPAPPSRLRRIVTVALWILIPVVIALAVVLYLNVRSFVRTDPRAAPSPPAAFSPATPPASPPPVQPPAMTPPPAGAVPSPPGPGGEGITLVLTATGTSWLRVIVDGERIFQGTVYAGDAGTWTAARALEIRIGNAGVVELTVNGRDLGTPGRPRQVVTLRFPESPEEP